MLIDWYVTRLFAKVFAVCLVSLSCMFILFTALNKLDVLLEIAEVHEHGTRLIAKYYAARILTFFEATSGLLTLIAAVFTVSWLQRTNEVTALMACGISKARILAPVLIASVVVSGLAIVNRELLIPRYRELLTLRPNDLLPRTRQPMQPRYDHKTDIFLSGAETVAHSREIVRPEFRLPGKLAGFGFQLAAEKARYLDADATHPGGYLLSGMTLPPPDDLAAADSAELNGELAVLSPKDTPWLKPDQCFVISAVDFHQLTAEAAWRRYGSTVQLIQALHNPSLDYGAHERVRIHARIVRPALDLTLLMLGIPFVFARNDRNLFVAAGYCLLVVSGFTVVLVTFHSMGSSYLIKPVLAAWLPLLVFAPIAYALSTQLWYPGTSLARG